MTNDERQRVALLVPGYSPITRAISALLVKDGWAVHETGEDPGAAIDAAAGEHGAVDALVYDPGLLDGDREIRPGSVVESLLRLVEQAGDRLRTRDDGGARIVVITTRDGLGWADRPELAAAGGALVSTARSLALRLGPNGTTVNAVAALPPVGSPLRDRGIPAGTHLREPAELLPNPVTVEDIAQTAAFFLDQRSGYLTGQVLYACGGASLLSSLSV